MNGTVSSNLSKSILNGFTNNYSFNKDVFDTLHLIVRKSAHVFEYFILSALLYNYLRFYVKENKKLYIYTFILNLICSIADEFHQLFIVDRTAKIFDPLIDSIGAIIFLIIIIIYKKNVTKRKSN